MVFVSFVIKRKMVITFVMRRSGVRISLLAPFGLSRIKIASAIEDRTRFQILSFIPTNPARGAPGPRKRGLVKVENRGTSTSDGSSPRRPKLS